ncbi:hypothetical protein L1080_008830 [Rhodococcus sp. MSC1_016]|jgi:hypothetical protein
MERIHDQPGRVLCSSELAPNNHSAQGHSPSLAIAQTVLTTIGEVAAATVVGPAMDRINAFRVLGSVYLGGAVFVAILGSVLMGTSAGSLLMAAFLTGTCVAGGQMSVIALATVVYPTAMRPTGVGWALGIGRHPPTQCGWRIRLFSLTINGVGGVDQVRGMTGCAGKAWCAWVSHQLRKRRQSEA